VAHHEAYSEALAGEMTGQPLLAKFVKPEIAQKTKRVDG